MERQAPDEESMVTTAVTNLERRFGSIDSQTIEAVVRRIVHQQLATAKVTLFVGVIAERGARAELQRNLEVPPNLSHSSQRS